MLYHANALRVDENMRMKPITRTYNNVSHHHDLQGSQCSVGLQCRQIPLIYLNYPWFAYSSKASLLFFVWAVTSNFARKLSIRRLRYGDEGQIWPVYANSDDFCISVMEQELLSVAHSCCKQRWTVFSAVEHCFQ